MLVLGLVSVLVLVLGLDVQPMITESKCQISQNDS